MAELTDLIAAAIKGQPTEAERGTSALMAEATTAWVQSLMGDAVRVRYGELTELDGVDACEVDATGDSPVVRRFVDGGGIYRFSYDVFLRSATRTVGDRLDALGLLGRLEEAIKTPEFPDADVAWVGHELDRAPALYGVDPSGNETYQLSATITYLVTNH